MAEPGIVVHVEGFGKRYAASKRWAVLNLSFDVAAGEAFALLGPNGAGKSTTVKAILGLISSTQGRVLVMNEDPRHTSVLRSVGYASEDSHLPDRLNGREVLSYAAALVGVSRTVRCRVVDEALEWAAIADPLRPIRAYSKGMRQRLNIAQALVGRPALLVLDEPTADLDPGGRTQVRDLIRTVVSRGAAVILNSHLISEVEVTCSRACILDDGRVVKSGQTSDWLTEGRSLEDVYLAAVHRPVMPAPAFLN